MVVKESESSWLHPIFGSKTDLSPYEASTVSNAHRACLRESLKNKQIHSLCTFKLKLRIIEMNILTMKDQNRILFCCTNDRVLGCVHNTYIYAI